MCRKIFVYLALFFILIFILFLTFTKGILVSYANFFILNNATKGADLILILSGDPNTRPIEAIKLVQNGYGNKIMVTDEKFDVKEKHHLVKRNTQVVIDIVKSEDLNISILPSTKGGATSTFDEAYDLVAFLKKEKLKHIIIVTDEFHTRRAYYAFNKIFEKENIKEVKLEISSAKNDTFNPTNWWKSEKGITSYILEPIKFIFYIFNSRNYKNIKEN